MPERDGYIPGVPCWVDTSQPDPEVVLDFYGGIFGWEYENVLPDDSGGKYFVARIRGLDAAAIGSVPDGAPPMAVWNTYIWVDSADEIAAKVRNAGGNVVTEPFDIFESGRMAVFSDPEGAVFCVWQANEHKGARIVNEHGTLNFNGLNTRDVEGRRRSTARSSAGRCWRSRRRPDVDAAGYGDHLETINPGLRKQVEEVGGPPGFEDVVASINPIPDDQPDTPPHWSVTFGVDDADETAAKAAELGGKVLVPPFDAPWVRMTILSDPAGATFIASQFVLENKDLAGPGEVTSRRASCG